MCFPHVKKVSVEDKLDIATTLKLKTDNHLKNVSNYRLQITEKLDKMPETCFLSIALSLLL